LTVLYRFDGFVRGQDRVCEKRVIDERRRIAVEEAEQVVKTLRDAGKTVDARYYANEGHGFTKRENQIDAIRCTIDFFDRYLKCSK
jgi:dipeptidyl aminopeptidase/acylaminoacyl peptidase